MGEPLTKLRLQRFRLALKTCGRRLLIRFWLDCNREIKTGEFSLLAAFVQHPHRPLSRERLIELARGPGSDTDSRSMDVQVSRVRKLVEPDPARPRYIQTVWGYGYVFVPDGQPRSR